MSLRLFPSLGVSRALREIVTPLIAFAVALLIAGTVLWRWASR
jgi:cation transporter-like permease